MTAQVHDSLQYLGEEHALVAFSDGEPFSPANAGYRPMMTCTACWRGYVCRYGVKDGLLQLLELQVNHHTGGAPVTCQQPPDLNGVAASLAEESFFGVWLFRDIGLPLTYTGGLVIGRGFIRSLYVHMGFHPAWNYQQVYELGFEQGRLIEARDASPEMARLRARSQHGLNPDTEATPDQIEEWTADCFSRDYGRKARGG